jgi:hypothetical protein
MVVALTSGLGPVQFKCRIQIHHFLPMSTSRAHITFPKEVRADLDRLVDKRHRGKFVTDAARPDVGRSDDTLQSGA